jgi:hypothetical protein
MSAVTPVTGPVQPTVQPTALTPAGTPASSGGLSFGDVLDAINPLQHIPILSGMFRAATGSHISDAAQVAGDTLYGIFLPGGAVAGLISSAADVAVKGVTGKNVEQHVVDTLSGPSATQGTAQNNAVPLTPASSSSAPAAASTANAVAGVQGVPHISIDKAHLMSNASYQRAQALDAINKKLVKMKV